MQGFLERLADEKPLIYDGGLGSQLFARGIALTNSTLASELHPDTVIDIHCDYIRAGADAIGTNTFVASELHLQMAGKKAADVNRLVRHHAVRCQATARRWRSLEGAKEAAARPWRPAPEPGRRASLLPSGVLITQPTA